MAKKYSRIIAVIMLVIAIVFIFIALNNPQASFPWSNEIKVSSIMIQHHIYSLWGICLPNDCAVYCSI